MIFDYLVGDSISFKGKTRYSSKKTIYKKGFIIKDYLKRSICFSRGGWKEFPDRNLCKTSFSWKSGNGTKNFIKDTLKSCRIVLVEKKIFYDF